MNSFNPTIITKQIQIMKTLFLLAASALSLSIVAHRATAQYATLGSASVGSGGGTSAGGVYSARSSVGQTAASQAASGGPYSTISGFGALYLLQSTNAPWLEIRRTATNTVLISWPSPSTGWALRQTTNVKTGTWVAPAEPVGDDGAVKFIVVNPPTGSRYYRLVKP